MQRILPRRGHLAQLAALGLVPLLIVWAELRARASGRGVFCAHRSRLALLCVVSLLCVASLGFVMLPTLWPWGGSDSQASHYPDALERKRLYADCFNVTEHEFGRGEMLYGVLLGKGLEPRQVNELIEASRRTFDLRAADPGDQLKLYRSKSGEVEFFELHRAKAGETLSVCRTPLGLIANRSEPVYTTRLALAEGTINNSLYADGLREGLDGRLVMELAEIFAWDIDSLADLQPGDKFRVIYEQKMDDAGLIKNGRILAAEMVNGGEVHTAYYFRDDDGHADYYDEFGRSLHKEFLKSPLRYARISSSFSYGRLHPILKIMRPHLGVDYAAPSGTPVEAVADGRVAYCGWKPGFGNYLELRHSHNLTTTYGHLRGFAGRLRRGELVRQGQVIGFVGATGMATGPHLDFRLAESGKWVDPVKKRPEPAEPIQPAMRVRFQSFLTEVHARFPSFESSARR
jgi:murein DD-endopeptidase MepM/ murein hydrolase activator NlpD